MSTPVLQGATVPAPDRAQRPTHPAVPFARLVRVELRKMFDTRAGFWLLVATAVLTVAATIAVATVGPDDALTYSNLVAAVGLPMSVVLPMIAVLAVTAEWSQRSGLLTFALVPRRARVMGAKAVATVTVGLVSGVLALVVAALGTVVGSATTGGDSAWDLGPSALPQILLGNLVGMAIGFTLGVVLRSSAAAIVGYFVLSFVLPGVLQLLVAARAWFADLQPWVDWNATQVELFEGSTDSLEKWAMLVSTTAIWIVLPLTVGLVLVRRSDVA